MRPPSDEHDDEAALLKSADSGVAGVLKLSCFVSLVLLQYMLEFFRGGETAIVCLLLFGLVLFELRGASGGLSSSSFLILVAVIGSLIRT